MNVTRAMDIAKRVLVQRRWCLLRAPTIGRLIALGGALLAPFVQAASLDAYGRLPSIEHVSLSPDGTRIAFVQRVGMHQQLQIRAVADLTLIASANVDDLKVRDVELVDERHLMLLTSATMVPDGYGGREGEWGHLLIFDVAKGTWSSAPDRAKIVDGPVQGLPLLDEITGRVQVRYVKGHTVLFFRAYYRLGKGLVPALLNVDLENEQEQLIFQSPLNSEVRSLRWAVSVDGNSLAEQEYSEKTKHWSLCKLVDGDWQEIIGGQSELDFPKFLGFGSKDDTLLMRLGDGGAPNWTPVSIKDGTYSKPIAHGDGLEEPIEGRGGGVIGRIDLVDYRSFTFLDSSVQARWEAALRAFPDDHVSLVSFSRDLKKGVLLIDGWFHGFQYRVIDFDSLKSDLLGPVYYGVPYLPVRRIDYPSRDGLQIPAYLTMPSGRKTKGLPLVVLVHGGPMARDTAEFDWWSQALADQGYAVLRPNFRGSTMDSKFVAAGIGEFGRKMQTDLNDGVRYLADEGIIDPARVCIAGGSYGGYAALQAATKDSGVFRCAVSVAGPSDMKAFLNWVNDRHRDRDNIEQRSWSRFTGFHGPDDPGLDQISPIHHIDTVRAPILLIHGKDDTVVPYSQSEGMYDALRNANKAVEFVTLRYEDHWLSRSETRLEMLKALSAFLHKNNPTD